MIVGKLQLGGRTRSQATQADNPMLQNVFALTPRPLRFVLVGGLGLVVDLSVFTLITWCGLHPLLARLASLAVATVITWRLNRGFTFASSGRDQGEEAVRYVAVVLLAQATSYAIFAALVLSIASRLPQAAVLAGAAVGALVSYTGYRLFAFAPRQSHMALTPTPNTRS
jgi:putative flippase GtrA